MNAFRFIRDVTFTQDASKRVGQSVPFASLAVAKPLNLTSPWRSKRERETEGGLGGRERGRERESIIYGSLEWLRYLFLETGVTDFVSGFQRTAPSVRSFAFSYTKSVKIVYNRDSLDKLQTKDKNSVCIRGYFTRSSTNTDAYIAADAQL